MILKLVTVYQIKQPIRIYSWKLFVYSQTKIRFEQSKQLLILLAEKKNQVWVFDPLNNVLG